MPSWLLSNVYYCERKRRNRLANYFRPAHLRFVDLFSSSLVDGRLGRPKTNRVEVIMQRVLIPPRKHIIVRTPNDRLFCMMRSNAVFAFCSTKSWYLAELIVCWVTLCVLVRVSLCVCFVLLSRFDTAVSETISRKKVKHNPHDLPLSRCGFCKNVFTRFGHYHLSSVEVIYWNRECFKGNGCSRFSLFSSFGRSCVCALLDSTRTRTCIRRDINHSKHLMKYIFN